MYKGHNNIPRRKRLDKLDLHELLQRKQCLSTSPQSTLYQFWRKHSNSFCPHVLSFPPGNIRTAMNNNIWRTAVLFFKITCIQTKFIFKAYLHPLHVDLPCFKQRDNVSFLETQILSALAFIWENSSSIHRMGLERQKWTIWSNKKSTCNNDLTLSYA